MLDCKSIATAMDANLKKLRDFTSDSNFIDPIMYRQLIGSLMYPTNTRPNICFAVNALSQFMCELRQIHWIAALLLGIISMVEAGRYFPRTRKIHHIYTEEIRNVRLQVHSYSDG